MIIARNIEKIYRQSDEFLRVLKGVDLTIQPGETVAIVGPSGAGKSTLLHVLGGLDQPTSGEVDFFGANVYQLDENQRAQLRNKQVGFVFQAYHLIAELTALENVILPAMIKNNSQKTSVIETHGVKLLEKVGLSARLAHRPSQLSGGEQQRVAIARSLMNNPRVLLCDEPTGNLDSQTGVKIIDLLLELNQEMGQTLVLVTHDQKIASRLMRTVYIRDGIIEK